MQEPTYFLVNFDFFDETKADFTIVSNQYRMVKAESEEEAIIKLRSAYSEVAPKVQILNATAARLID